GLGHLVELGPELVYVPEAAVDARKADERHFVELAQNAHHSLSDLLAGHFLGLSFDELAFELVDEPLDADHGDRALVAGEANAPEHLLAVERLPGARFLSDHRPYLLA